ncbi:MULTISPECIES: glycosyltransferase family 2 protein [Roseivirga]|uniref:Glycosyl transferase n=1 Tax=Roseivirga spongicola TaxID=333140 RepID=A0A150X4F8_9BACT|nr:MULTISPECIES: glycosyltransferase family 2 protein [Roseivirga]KYG73492.1 glycosyl transferase [Roseivirga spongicola]MBO6659755.1 glycosyltransferase family 2 protein [Roseivirga sp.]MBO6760322.1 glycosyltransferase family 2 protein [Roseivirga sp.]MBO6907508.1 glycosyltransferase family 2 protein [Roseivirga sp.]WPZ09881.1 glycosyltransferase family 2 protein [Roseivirga spongicola]
MEIFFWTCVFIVFYVFVGYGMLISILAKIKGTKPIETLGDEDLPEVTFLVAAYNEEEIIEEKIKNTLALDYPKDKLKIKIVTDGSNDGTNDIVSRFSEAELCFKPERAGKIAAVNRVMPSVESALTVFTDANVMINKDGLKNMIRHFQSNLVGAVSGEKTVLSKEEDSASSSGEGFYWKYESFLKRKDAEWNTLVGSAGELFAIRTHLYENIDTNTLIEDFVMTMKLSAKGYKVAYEPQALAMETGSANIEEETKRKVRISAGGIQAVIMLLPLLNLFKYGKLTFQYISHRALRWTLMPLALVGAFTSIFFLAPQGWPYDLIMRLELIFAILALAGYAMRNGETKIKALYIPYYFIYMHYCVVLGWIKYFRGKQQVTWDKAKRATPLQQVQSLN